MSLVRDALSVLGIEELVLGVHDACFPSAKGEDVGRGSPNGQGARDLVDYASELGFSGLQLGPQGETSDDDPSPYDGAVFSRSHRSIALLPLLEMGLLSRATFDRLAGDQLPSNRSDHVGSSVRIREALEEVFGHEPPSDVAAFVERERPWLERDGLFEAIANAHGGADFVYWPDPRDRDLFADPTRASHMRALHQRELARFGFVQWIAHQQHGAFRAHARSRGLALLGDLQIGWSRRDLWAWSGAFLRDFVMGAPPSRTNPDGQPWGYAVLDPDLGPEASALFDLRVAHELSLYDGLRIDHPHGHVCPWVYTDDVRAGARLRESPDRPELARFAIARNDQIDFSRQRYDDAWVKTLEPAQVDRYAQLFDRLVGRSPHIVCEVLSTLPYPLAQVLHRHRLGRFRVTQKASLDDPRDVYRSENACPEDWIMVGNHDTEPISVVARRWLLEGSAERHAARLAERLAPDDREAFVREAARDHHALARACLAELFASPARHVYVWWNDLFGDERRYNMPGTISPENWVIRIPSDFRAAHARAMGEGRGLDLPRALAVALRARKLAPDLAARLVV
ncbi:MAG: 4-alpha-glucanotransferase [Polyangiales bacterium]